MLPPRYRGVEALHLIKWPQAAQTRRSTRGAKLAPGAKVGNPKIGSCAAVVVDYVHA